MVGAEEDWYEGEPDDAGGVHCEPDIPDIGTFRDGLIFPERNVVLSHDIGSHDGPKSYLASLKFSGIFLALTAWTVQRMIRIML
jgi:hypothetical protein